MSWMNIRTAVKISIANHSEQEGEPDRMILMEILSVKLERVVFRLRRSRQIFLEIYMARLMFQNTFIVFLVIHLFVVSRKASRIG